VACGARPRQAPRARGGNAIATRRDDGNFARMKRLPTPVFGFVLVAALTCAPFVPAQDNMMNAAAVAKGGHFVKPEGFDLAKALPEPPAPGSLAAQADLEAVLQMQAWRTPEQEAWTKFIDKDNAFNHASVLGAWFAKETLPVTAAFLADVTEDVNAVGALTKQLHARLRPPQVDARVQPCLPVPATASYPSGHAMRAFAWAAVLAEIFPEKRDELFARAHRAAWSRVIAGLHFPSDTIGGRRLAEAVVAELKKSAAFRAAVEKCRAEAAPFLLKKAA
jgi:acid phosphatase (class A)